MQLREFLPKTLFGRMLSIILVPMIFVQIITVFIFYDRHWEKIITRFSNIAINQINLIKNEYKINGLERAKEVANKLNIELLIVEEKELIKEKNTFLKKKN